MTDPRPFSDDDWEQLRELLRRDAATAPDQWSSWRTGTPIGTVYIRMDRQRPDGTLDEMFASIDSRDD